MAAGHIIRTSRAGSLALAWEIQTKENHMTKRIPKVFAVSAALMALAVGGSAIASAQQPGQAPAPVRHAAPAAEPVGGPDTDSIQSGDQTTPDTAAASAAVSTTKAAASEAPGTEQPPADEAAGAAEQPGSESAANSDGPGGHADEPGNAAADHQFQGAE
jgi:hypothetical protein